MKKIFVKPVNGLTVIHPISMAPIKQEGEIVLECTQIKRYLKFGDLEISKEPKKKTTKTQEKE
ncbi:hypothetical protein CL634_09600 [bacterium]|nr:hypothetical protein [bacterium]|tara:strand:- start:630 stop:818 length:189 start_codon:yes stop_codon:yes gene_type:complete